MTVRPIGAAFFASLLLAGAQHCLCVPSQQSDSHENFQQLLKGLADFSPDPCGPADRQDSNWDVESRLFYKAEDSVTQALNAGPSGPESARERAGKALKEMERMSTEVNTSWPEENRLRFQMLDLPHALVIEMSVRTHERFFVFGIPQEDSGKPNWLWRNVGENEDFVEHDVPRSRLDLYALRPGPSGNARFLAKFILGGCAGSSGVEYDAREWDPKGDGDLEQIIKQSGSFGLDDNVAGFPQIGELRTQGSAITLPFCWFSPIDTWDNPSLCAVDTYDISGDKVKFRSRTYNRPDLLPIAKAIGYAEQRDYSAVLAYCVSSEIARTLVRDLPPSLLAGDIRVTRTGNGKERVELGYRPPTYRFDVEERGGGWRIAAFSTK